MPTTKKQSNPRRFRLKAKRRQNRRRQNRDNKKLQRLMNLGYPKAEAEKMIKLGKRAIARFGNNPPFRGMVVIIDPTPDVEDAANSAMEEAELEGRVPAEVDDMPACPEDVNEPAPVELQYVPSFCGCQGGYRAAFRSESAEPMPSLFQWLAQKFDAALDWAASYRKGGRNYRG